MNRIILFWLIVVGVTAGGTIDSAIPPNVVTSSGNETAAYQTATVAAQTVPQNTLTSTNTTGVSFTSITSTYGLSFTSKNSLQNAALNGFPPGNMSFDSTVPYS